MSDFERAWRKIRGMKAITLQAVREALDSLILRGWFDPFEAYAPDLTMKEWRQLVLSEVEYRHIYEVSP